jgi:WD40 repeat protein/serine/threonine protein kinase
VTELDLFISALERADPAQRAAFLDQHCAHDPQLRRRLEELLTAHERGSSPLDRASLTPRTSDATAELSAADSRREGVTGTFGDSQRPETVPTPVGQVIGGRYTLVEVIGEGGMGTVYLAEQSEPVKRRVALKLIKVGMDSKAVLARFEAERQALALMDHPNIARVYDGGTTADGRPFFVMELVKGVPINRYCDQKRLPVKARLELFVQVCQAVQHAHQKGIIHRDLKPSNVLVTEVDGQPVPKVIDFGVAKATQGKLTDGSLATNAGAILGTLEYMSPEQAGYAGEDVDTRADIYALGGILYELLTGLRPLDARKQKQGSLLEMVRLIQEVEPARPSTRLSEDPDQPSLAALRQTEPRKLVGLLRGELDWVVMKALEKDRARRYETALGLASDIQRYLADEVVEARPPSAGYRLWKFVRRHKGQVLACSLLLLTLLGGIVGTTLGLVQANRSAEEEKKARKAERERGEDLKYQLGVSDMVLASAAYDNRDVVLAAERLEKVPEKQRRWEWNYLKQQTRGGLFTLYGHTGPVLGVAFSPDGERIVTASGQLGGRNELTIWDARTGAAVFEVNDLPGIRNLNWERQVFGLGGTRLATAGRDNAARLWDVRTGKRQWELKHASPVLRVALSPDGSRLVTVCLDGKVFAWDAQTGKPQWEFKGTGEWIRVYFSPDGTRLFAGPLADQAEVLDASTGNSLCRLAGVPKAIPVRGGGIPAEQARFAFSPDGKRIVSSGAYVARALVANVWDAEKGGPPLLDLKKLTGSPGGFVSFSPDGSRILTGASIGATAQVWDASTGDPVFTLKERQGPAVVGFRHRGWAAGEQGVAFSPDGTRIVTAGVQLGIHEATVWDARTGAELLAMTGHTNMVLCAAYSPDGTRIVTGSEDGTAKVWDARTGTPRIEMNWHSGELYVVAVSPDGTRIVTGGGENFQTEKPGTATVWDARTGTALLELKGFKGPVKSAAFSPDGTRIVIGSYWLEDGDLLHGSRGEARVWDARTGAALLELKGLKEGVNDVAISPDGTRILTASGGPVLVGSVNELKLWDARTGAVLLDLTQPGTLDGQMEDHRGASVCFSPDSKRFVAGGLGWKAGVANWATVRDAATGAELFELKGHTSTLACVAYSPDGTRIVTGGGDGDRRALVWDAETGTALLELKGHTSGILCVAYSQDSKRIVTGSVDRTVRVWDTKTGTALLELKGFKERVNSVAFTADGMRIVTGEVGGAITVWDTPPQASTPVLRGHTGVIIAASFSPDGKRLATGSRDRTVKVWDTLTGTALLDLKGHEASVLHVAFSPDGTRIASVDGRTAKVWDARTGEALVELKGTPQMATVAFSRDGTSIVTRGSDGKPNVWDVGTGKELPGVAIPETLPNERISPDGRLFAYVDHESTNVDLVLLKPDEKELAYRRLHTQPNVGRYREGYLAARAAKDDFAAGFYLKLLPPSEQKVLSAQAAAEREIAAGRAQEAIAHLAIVSAAKPDDWDLVLKLAALRAWFGQDQELAEMCGRALESAKGASDPATALAVARMCCLRTTPDKARQEAVLALAKKAVELDGKNPFCRLALGTAEYRSGHFAEADAALLAAPTDRNGILIAVIAEPSLFFRAVIRFRQGKPEEARKLALEGAGMTRVPRPKDEKNPLAGHASTEDLIRWLAHKEANALIGFDAPPPAPPPQ